jgi:hypothetical protein
MRIIAGRADSILEVRMAADHLARRKARPGKTQRSATTRRVGVDYLSTQSCCAGYLGISDWLLLGTSDRKRHCEKRLIKEKRGANLELGRRCLGQGVLCWTVSALPNLSASFSRVKWAELKGSNPQPRGKACCHLISGTYEEMKRSRGRIRDQRMRPAGERAESN